MTTLIVKNMLCKILIGAALAGVLGLFFGGCGVEVPPETSLPDCAGQDDPEWYFYDCKDRPASICSGADAKQRAKECVFKANGFPIYCTTSCDQPK